MLFTEAQALEDGRIAKTEKGRRNQHFHGLGEDTMVQAVLALEHPLITIADKGTDGNPALSMLLPVFDGQDHPIHAVVSFYADEKINGSYKNSFRGKSRPLRRRIKSVTPTRASA